MLYLFKSVAMKEPNMDDSDGILGYIDDSYFSEAGDVMINIKDIKNIKPIPYQYGYSNKYSMIMTEYECYYVKGNMKDLYEELVSFIYFGQV